LGHQNLIGEIHTNCLFSGYANDNIDMQNTFFSCLQNNGVRYYIGGHEHIFNRAIVASPNGLSKVQNITNCASSTKFYEPKQPDNVDFKGQKYRQTQVAQETHHIGYTICTVDGLRVSSDGDQDGDGDVDDDDVAIVVAHRGFTSAEFPASDLDYDGKITVLDARKAVLLKTVN
jgi:hypothetical protein